VAVVFPGALGDLLLALPALRALRARHAGAHLTLAVSEPLRPLAALARVADATASLDGGDLARLLGGGPAPAWLAGATVYSWLGATDESILDRIRIGAGSARFFRVERGGGTVHAAVAYARALEVREDLRALARAARVSPPPSARAEHLWSVLGEPVLALHAGAGARAKRWDREGFAALARWWRAAGGSVLAVFGPAEAGEPALAEVYEVRDWPLVELAAVLARSTLYVGNDSGVSHLTAAVGTAGVVLFGPTAPERWCPLGGGVTPLRGVASGPGGISLDALPVERVIAACRAAGKEGSANFPRARLDPSP
jgi:ADP-heptose:LPS heptosyltransferase